MYLRITSCLCSMIVSATLSADSGFVCLTANTAMMCQSIFCGVYHECLVCDLFFNFNVANNIRFEYLLNLLGEIGDFILKCDVTWSLFDVVCCIHFKLKTCQTGNNFMSVSIL